MKTKTRGLIFFVIGMGIINLMLFPSAGTVDARNWEGILRDVMARGAHFIPDCLNYLCKSNFVLEKFPPGHFLLFYLFSFLFPPKILGTLLATKAIILFFYVATGGAILWFVRFMGLKKWSTISVIGIFLSLISLILNAQGLAYTDMLAFPFLIVGIGCLLRRRYLAAGIFCGLSFLVKWQPIMLLPIFIIYILKAGSSRIRHLLAYGGGMGLVLGFFYILNPNIVHALFLSLQSAMGHHVTYALNITWFVQSIFPSFGYIAHPGVPYPPVTWWQKTLFSIPYSVVVIRYAVSVEPAKRASALLQALVVGLVTYYLFSFGVHENHFITATIVACMLYLVDPTTKNRVILFSVDAINVINMFLFYGLTGTSFIPHVILGVNVSVVLALLFSFTGLLYWWHWVFGARSES